MRMVLTGTTAYGPFTTESDIDIATVRYEIEGLIKALKFLGIQVRNHKHINPIYEGIWFRACGRIIQFIVLNTESELEAWQLATEDMKKLKPFADRNRRVKIFQKYYQKHLANSDDPPSGPTKITENKPTYDYEQDDIPTDEYGGGYQYYNSEPEDDDIPF